MLVEHLYIRPLQLYLQTKVMVPAFTFPPQTCTYLTTDPEGEAELTYALLARRCTTLRWLWLSTVHVVFQSDFLLVTASTLIVCKTTNTRRRCAISGSLGMFTGTIILWSTRSSHVAERPRCA